MLWVGHALIAHGLYRWLPPGGDSPDSWGRELLVAAWVAAVVAAAELLRVCREQWARERVERQAAEQRRADEERLRIARELHDVLAHSISVINVQAGVGLALLDSDPEQARTALTTVKAASKEALGEVRQVLDALRTPGGAPRSPAPGLDRLPELVEQAAGVGLSVALETRGYGRTCRPAPASPPDEDGPVRISRAEIHQGGGGGTERDGAREAVAHQEQGRADEQQQPGEGVERDVGVGPLLGREARSELYERDHQQGRDPRDPAIGLPVHPALPGRRPAPPPGLTAAPPFLPCRHTATLEGARRGGVNRTE
ncbi:sensor histidine kinase [Streptomyces sp. NPDC093795]|uniref:sensor histidine kinase n=1 Tax=Streptomyces sp. NPDC093795 TaxID=3366051 RepID=UPI0038210D1F